MQNDILKVQLVYYQHFNWGGGGGGGSERCLNWSGGGGESLRDFPKHVKTRGG